MSEPGAGSDVISMKLKAEDKGGYYVLNGGDLVPNSEGFGGAGVGQVFGMRGTGADQVIISAVVSGNTGPVAEPPTRAQSCVDTPAQAPASAASC